MGVMKGMMEYGSGFVVGLLIFVRIERRTEGYAHADRLDTSSDGEPND